PQRRRLRFFAGVVATPSAAAPVCADSCPGSGPGASSGRAASEGSPDVTVAEPATAGLRLRGCPDRWVVFGIAAPSVTDETPAVTGASPDPSDAGVDGSTDPSFAAAVAAVPDRPLPRPRPPRRRRRDAEVRPGACSAGDAVVLPPSGVGVTDPSRP